jgi:cyclophilin family peptidyl-prolyl cis-trans isomerase
MSSSSSSDQSIFSSLTERTGSTDFSLLIATEMGNIKLQLAPHAAPQTVVHVSKLVDAALYTNVCFYRSDFVIQCGLQTQQGTVACENPFPDIAVNETKISNVRGTAAFGHWDVPDNGNSEFFINLKDNPHLNEAYGGYAVFAYVCEGDVESFAVVDSIAAAILEGKKPLITGITRI